MLNNEFTFPGLRKPRTSPITSEQVQILKDTIGGRIRLAREDDSPRLVAFFNQLSNETKYKRFMKYRKSISSRSLEKLVASCGETVALVAEIDVGGEQVLIADGRFVIEKSTESAEVGIVILDYYQRKGLGLIIMELLALEALRRGIRYFTGDILADNTAMLNLLKKTGYDIEFASDGYIKHFRIDLRQIVPRLEEDFYDRRKIA